MGHNTNTRQPKIETDAYPCCVCVARVPRPYRPMLRTVSISYHPSPGTRTISLSVPTERGPTHTHKTTGTGYLHTLVHLWSTFLCVPIWRTGVSTESTSWPLHWEQSTSPKSKLNSLICTDIFFTIIKTCTLIRNDFYKMFSTQKKKEKNRYIHQHYYAKGKNARQEPITYVLFMNSTMVATISF